MKEEKGLKALIARLESETGQINAETKMVIRRLWQWGIERITDDAVRKSVNNYFEVRVPCEFFILKASTSKSPHVRWHNGPGGLARHIVESCILLDIFLNSYGYTDRDKRIREDARWMRDIVLAATLISDTQKCGIPWSGKTVINHGEIAAERWKIVAIGCGVSYVTMEKILEAITWHYGRFTPSDNPKEFHQLPDYVQIVHLADSISSLPIIENIFNPRRRIPPPLPKDM